MKVSIVTAILDSHEIAKRQLLHYNKIDLPGDVEVIFVDDGSKPPLNFAGLETHFKFILYATNNFQPWTQPAARNFGARRANGEYLILTDIDHIISREVVEIARDPQYDVIRFKREVAVLDENGDFTQDRGILAEYGFNRKRLRIAPHGNSYIMRTSLYLGLGGVDERYVGTGKYPNREEVPLKRKLKTLAQQEQITICDDDTKPIIYMIPNGRYCGDKDYNPFGLFHNLSRQPNIGRETNKQKWERRRKRRWWEAEADKV